MIHEDSVLNLFKMSTIRVVCNAPCGAATNPVKNYRGLMNGQLYSNWRLGSCTASAEGTNVMISDGQAATLVRQYASTVADSLSHV